MHGLTLAEILVEEGVSGSVPGRGGPAGGALFAKLRARRRRHRAEARPAFSARPSTRSRWSRASRRRGVALHLLDLGGDISGNGLSKLFLTIAAAFAEAERDRIRERIGQVKADQKARGRYLGGSLPFGFRRGDDGELVPVDAEQEAIREMVALRGQGAALRAIADVMRAKGVKVSHEGVRAALEVQRGAGRASPSSVNRRRSAGADFSPPPGANRSSGVNEARKPLESRRVSSRPSLRPPLTRLTNAPKPDATAPLSRGPDSKRSNEAQKHETRARRGRCPGITGEISRSGERDTPRKSDLAQPSSEGTLKLC